jgi:beta-lactamase class D
VSLSVRKGDVCDERHPPASTFKVPHALIALETGARTDANDRETWDGTDYGGAAWNQDQTLRSALQHSTYWYFKRTAQRIGLDRMRASLERLNYGNASVGNDVTTFWLKGPLAISATEQANFMVRFVRRELPMRADVMNTVDEILVEPPGKVWRGEARDVDATWDAHDTQVYGKTGSMDGLAEGSVRWFVGHVHAHGHDYAFASLVTGHAALDFEAVALAVGELKTLRLIDSRS